MKLIVGLGNPGQQYENTWHNVGFMVVDKLARSSWLRSKSGNWLYSWLGSQVELLKPQTFMNASGEAVLSAVKKHRLKPEDVWVVHDDLDIRLGEFKVQFGKGPKVHNGIDSVVKMLKTDQFWRVRIGVENRPVGDKIPGRAYVLSTILGDEAGVLAGVISQVVERLEMELDL